MRASLGDTDAAVLGPLAAHRILIAPQVALLLGVSDDAAARRLRRLREAGLVTYDHVFSGVPGVTAITRRGLTAIGSSLPTPRLDPRGYRHDVGVGWLWLAARAGSFGELSAIATDRELRALGATRTSASVPGGVGLGLLGPHGRPQRHYPDLMLTTTGGQHLAIELELTAKSTRRMSRIMLAYASDARVDSVLYLVPSASIAQLVTQAAGRSGAGGLIHVQRLAPRPISGADALASRSRSQVAPQSAPAMTSRSAPRALHAATPGRAQGAAR